MEERVFVKSEPVRTQENSILKVLLKGEYELKPHVWVKQEVLLKEEIQDTISEGTDEGQPSHPESNPFTGVELEIVKEEVEDSHKFNNLESDLILNEDQALPEGFIETESLDSEESSQDSASLREHGDSVSMPSQAKTNLYQCNICWKTFVYHGSVKRHLVNVHQYQRKFSCLQCKTSFTERETLKHHIQMHHCVQIFHRDKRKFPCLQCSTYFTRSETLELHVQLCHEKNIKFPCAERSMFPFHCSKCSKSFTRKVSLQDHLVNDHGVPRRRYPCLQCSKFFTTHYGLEQHKTDFHDIQSSLDNHNRE